MVKDKLEQKNKHLPEIFILFLFGITISPFIFWPYSKIAFEVPKVFFINRWIELLVICYVLFLPKINVKNSNRTDLKLVILAVIFFISSVISSFLGSNLNKSIVGNYYRADGLITLAHLIMLMLFVAIFIKKDWIEKCVSAIAISATAISTISFVYFIFEHLIKIQIPYFSEWQGGIGIMFGNPNFLAGFLIVTLPFSYFLAEKKSKLHSLFFMLQVIAILLTRAWSGVFCTLAFLIYIFIRQKKIIPIVLLFILLTVAAVKFISTNTLFNIIDSPLRTESRQRIFMKGILGLEKKPFFGYGTANFDYAFQSSNWPIKINDDVYVDKAHSSLLEVLTTTGVIGFTIYILIISRVFYNLYKSDLQIKIYLILSLTLFLFHSQTNIISISEEIIFWIIAGISARSYSLNSS